MSIDDDYAPLRRGTRAIVRQASLSGIANRYVDLTMPAQSAPKIPDGGVIDQDATTSAVDLDQVFNTFDPETRKDLQRVFKGSDKQYKGKGQAMNEGLLYLNPSLSASSKLFNELNRDTPLLERFIVSSSKLVTDVADRRDDLAGLVDHLATTTTAIGSEQAALADAIGQLPPFMRRANTTFLNLRATLDDLDPLVEDSKPVAKKLRPFMAELRPLARDARPTFRDLAEILGRPGADNDALELTRLQPPLRDATVREVEANGKKREGAFPADHALRARLRADRRLRAPVRAGRARLVRRLQPLRHLRRARRRLARRHPRERVHRGQRPALARAAGAARRRPSSRARRSTSATAARARPSTRTRTAPTRGSRPRSTAIPARCSRGSRCGASSPHSCSWPPPRRPRSCSRAPAARAPTSRTTRSCSTTPSASSPAPT